jgi:hypothetical protein
MTKMIASAGQLRVKLSQLGLQCANYFSWEKTRIATAAILNF